MNVIDTEKPDGVLVQFGGQTPLNIARQLADAGVPIWGTSIDAIEKAEDREAFNAFMRALEIPQPEGYTATSPEQVIAAAESIG
jgi:carbamoyl-phosphate synthase large subunit